MPKLILALLPFWVNNLMWRLANNEANLTYDEVFSAASSTHNIVKLPKYQLLFKALIKMSESGMRAIDFIIMLSAEFCVVIFIIIFHVVLAKSVKGLSIISKEFEEYFT